MIRATKQMQIVSWGNICLFKFLVLTLFWRLPSNIFRLFVFVTYNRSEPLYSSALIISSHQRGARSMGPTRIAQMNDQLRCNKLLPGDADDEGGGSWAKNKTKAAFDKGQYFLSRQKRYQMPANAQYHEYTEQRRKTNGRRRRWLWVGVYSAICNTFQRTWFGGYNKNISNTTNRSHPLLNPGGWCPTKSSSISSLPPTPRPPPKAQAIIEYALKKYEITFDSSSSRRGRQDFYIFWILFCFTHEENRSSLTPEKEIQFIEIN